MSVIENQMKLGRELFEINTHVARRMTEITGEGIKQYFEANQDFAKRLAEVRDITSFMELQRDYGQALYNGVTERLQTRGEVLKEAVERGSDAVRGAFSAAQETAENVVEEVAA
jgi:CHASE3 domain sensor protein